MTRISHRELATRVVLIYWLTLLGGLALFTATRAGDAAVTTSLWIGAVGGTLLGQYLALHNFRLWIAVLTIAAAGIYCGPLVPSGEASTQLWQAFIPAALCGFWSLGDRAVLAAAWFPTVIWMLTILDRSDRIAPDGAAAILLGGLAGLFIWFLAARESRRVALWRSVAAEPLAAAQPAELLREPPGRQLARAGWWLSVGALTVAITVWLAPPLWQSETLGGPVAQLPDAPFVGLHCCPVNRDADTQSSRIKEYLDLGLGHGEHTAAPLDGGDCRDCSAPVPQAPQPGAVAATGPAGDGVVPWSGTLPAPGRGVTIDVGGERGGAWPGAMPARGGSVRVRAGWSPLPPDPPSGERSAPPAPGAPNPPASDPSRASGASGASGASASEPATTSGPGAATTDPVTGPPRVASPSGLDPSAADAIDAATGAPRVASPADLDPWAPWAASQAGPAELSSPAHPLAGAPGGTPASGSTRPPGSPPAAAPIPGAPAPAPAPVQSTPPPAGATAHPTAHYRAATDLVGPSLLHWLAFAVVAAVVFQLVRLGLRPVRRLVTLRHLRRPFWDETVAQRVSNSWQLALVGLRDAGWRTGPSEPPRELARRIRVDGLDRCAAILERARHGVGLDAGDLGEMQTSADAAYRAARTGLGGLARTLGWLRWPLT